MLPAQKLEQSCWQCSLWTAAGSCFQ